ncbi:hypothetical protein F5J12DRAFT_787454 [Pisolithus orientalis]|uniref:uncharacterized protein n=1 Tax=Pisolithus orientalis TaxID=936130 RepID=UPI0022245847|nr:uncharacterized protein F5J12DRAFT_787454 [Pisolithus orientalis]KAI5984983.1 hypothetical protein F5J12DRAFT_787454 [Pisolithus orientalis]
MGVFSWHLIPTAKYMLDKKLEPLMKEYSLDMQYLPYVNKYLQPLWEHVVQLSCASDNNSELELDELQVPDNIFDGTHDPWMVLGFDVMGSGNNDTQRGHVSPSWQGSLEANIQEPAGMEAFTAMLCNLRLLKDEVQLGVVVKFLKLRKYLNSCGLDASNCFHHSDGHNWPCLEDARESTLRHILGDGGSLKPSKSDKVEAIKDKLLDMLNHPYDLMYSGKLKLHYEWLPWYTLKKDLEKHRFALVNWLAGVLHKCGDRGIHDLSAVEVNKLYKAVTCLTKLTIYIFITAHSH